VTAITVPGLVRDGTLACIVSISGGKDSTATALALREAGVPFSMVFADTGWEAPETYAHLDHLREKLGPIDVVRAERQMAEAIRHSARFPAGKQRWCTRELKIVPLRAFHDRAEAMGRETCSVMGMRAAESKARSSLAEFEDEPQGDRSWGGWVWRPILSWDVAEVLAIHHRHGVDLNPLYLRGHDRVGCWPCIFANKEQIRLLAEQAPERIDEIRTLERDVTLERERRNVETPGRYESTRGTFFRVRGSNGTAGMLDIDTAVAWSRTERGGKSARLQLRLWPSDGGCFRWGLCEPPSGEREEPEAA
jgi:3'-phosphoadenosine 5'-phosphosulfate sulfotransferase (PAPS reductase)/FAD synthetase